MRVLALIAASAANGLAAKESGSATQKVIQMLEEMKAKGQKRMQDEQVAFAKFDQFCKDEQGSTKKAIDEAAEEMSELNGTIAKATQDAEDLGNEIATLGADIEKYNAQLKTEREERKKTHAEFLVTEKDLSESVDALSRAIIILKRQPKTIAQAQSFLQESAGLPARARSLAMALMDDEDMKPGEAHGFTNSSGKIVNMLKKLQTDFKTELNQARTAEMNSKHAMEMVVQDLTDSVSRSEEAKDEKAIFKQKNEQAAAKANKELNVTTASHKADKEKLADLEVECKEKSLSFHEKQKLAGDEIDAIQEAVKILSDPKVLGAAQKHLSMVQKKTSLLQIGSKVAHRGDHDSIMAFLHQSAEKFHSKNLALLASKLAQDPFAKVKKLIKQMMQKLREQAQKEAEKKSFCDKNQKENAADRKRLTHEMDQLQSTFDAQTSLAEQLREEIETLSSELVELEKGMGEATKLRIAEKEKNGKTIKEAEQAQAAVAAAKSVLENFYNSAKSATAFLQNKNKDINYGGDDWNAAGNPAMKGKGGYGDGSEATSDSGHKEGMQTFGETYQGQQQSSTGVLAMLEVILSDFAKLQAETETAEKSASTEYDRYMADSKKDKAVKTRKVEMNKEDAVAAENEAKAAKRDLSTTDDQLQAANRVRDNLQEQCAVKTVTFEERQKQRQEEIDSLKQALEMLAPPS